MAGQSTAAAVGFRAAFAVNSLGTEGDANKVQSQDIFFTDKQPLLESETLEMEGTSGLPSYADGDAFTIRYKQVREAELDAVKNVTKVFVGGNESTGVGGQWYLYVADNARVYLPGQTYTDTTKWSPRTAAELGIVVDPDTDVGVLNRALNQYPDSFQNKSIDADQWTTGGGWLRHKTVHTLVTTIEGLKDVYTNTLKADYPIAIDFIQGSSAPYIKVFTKSNLTLEGDMESPEHGTILLESQFGSITGGDSVAIYGATPEVHAGQGVEDIIRLNIEGNKIAADANNKLSDGNQRTLHRGDLVERGDGLYRFTGNGKVVNSAGQTVVVTGAGVTLFLNNQDYSVQRNWLKVADAALIATTGGDITVNAISLDNASSRFKIGRIHSSKGDVLVNAADGIYADNTSSQITGELVELDAFRGAIGSSSLLLKVDSDIDGIAKTGGLAARARFNIDIIETNAADTAGNMKLVQPVNWLANAAIESTEGNVQLRTSKGSILDGIVELFRPGDAGTTLTYADLSAELKAAYDAGEFTLDAASYPVSPGLMRVLFPHTSFLGLSPATSAIETPNIISVNVPLVAGGNAGGPGHDHREKQYRGPRHDAEHRRDRRAVVRRAWHRQCHQSSRHAAFSPRSDHSRRRHLAGQRRRHADRQDQPAGRCCGAVHRRHHSAQHAHDQRSDRQCERPVLLDASEHIVVNAAITWLIITLRSPSIVNVYKWTGTDATGKLTLLKAPAGSTFSLVNSGPVSVPWSFIDKYGYTTPQAGELIQVGVDLTALFGANVPRYVSFLAETRSSTSTMATLSDFALGSVATVHTRYEVKPGPYSNTVTVFGKDPTSGTTVNATNTNYHFGTASGPQLAAYAPPPSWGATPDLIGIRGTGPESSGFEFAASC